MNRKRLSSSTLHKGGIPIWKILKKGSPCIHCKAGVEVRCVFDRAIVLSNGKIFIRVQYTEEFSSGLYPPEDIYIDYVDSVLDNKDKFDCLLAYYMPKGTGTTTCSTY